jgi:hypothetical protein
LPGAVEADLVALGSIDTIEPVPLAFDRQGVDVVSERGCNQQKGTD